jgi:hypothetical protein
MAFVEILTKIFFFFQSFEISLLNYMSQLGADFNAKS